jgi:hypothetical protein
LRVAELLASGRVAVWHAPVLLTRCWRCCVFCC